MRLPIWSSATISASNVIAPGATNGLTETLGIEPTPLDAGLHALCDLQPEQRISDGVGSLKRKR